MRKFLLALILTLLIVPALAEEQKVVGVLMSDYTARWYAELGFSGSDWDYLAEMKRIFDFVRGLGYSCAPVFNRDLELYANPEADPVVKFERVFDLNKVKLLILPNTRRMSPLEIEAVRKFIDNGGYVFALAQASFRNHNNSSYDVSTVFALGDIFKVSYSAFAWKPPVHGFIRKATDHPIWEGIDEFVPTPRHWAMVVEILEDAKVLGEWYNDDKETPSHMPDVNAAIVEGKNCIYVGEDLFLSPNFDEPLVQLLLANIIDYFMKK